MIIYLASPYTHIQPEVREERYQLTMAAVAHHLPRERHAIFSPIVYCHEMAKQFNLPTDFLFWETFNFRMLSQCACLWVLQLPGWEESAGVQGEINFAKQLGMTIQYLHPNGSFSVC